MLFYFSSHITSDQCGTICKNIYNLCSDASTCDINQAGTHSSKHCCTVLLHRIPLKSCIFHEMIIHLLMLNVSCDDITYGPGLIEFIYNGTIF